MRIYWINQLSKGKIGMFARPKGGGWLEIDIKKLSLTSTDIVVSLLDYPEIKELELESKKILCDQYGIKYINYSIKDNKL